MKGAFVRGNGLSRYWALVLGTYNGHVQILGTSSPFVTFENKLQEGSFLLAPLPEVLVQAEKDLD